MEENVFAYLKEKQLMNSGSKVLVAVSGGPDSLALLHFLWRHQQTLGIKLSAITVDHQLRGALSRADTAFVADTCASWNIPCSVVKVDVERYKRSHKAGTQLAARELRYDVFYNQMRHENSDYLAFGHHADDQIETVMMAMTKSADVHNLGGMPARRSFACGEIIRPFLQVEKKEIMTYIHKYELSPRLDASNLEKDYMRNRMRADVIPLLKQENPNLAVTVGKLAERLQEDSNFAENEAIKAYRRCVTVDKALKKATIHITAIKEYPLSLQRRVFRLTLDYLYHMLPEQLSYKHETIFFSLLHEDKNTVLDFPLGLRLERAYHAIYIYFPEQEAWTPGAYLLEKVPDTIQLWDGTVMTCTLTELGSYKNQSNSAYTYISSLSMVEFPLTIRPKNPGDRMTYDGLSGTKKLQRIFIDEKIPRHKRDTWPVVTDATGEVLWLVGLKKNTKHSPQDEPYICMEITSNNSYEEANNASRD